MNGLGQAVRKFQTLWNHGDEDFEDDDELGAADLGVSSPSTSSSYSTPAPSYTAPSQRGHAPAHGGGGKHGGSSHGVRRLHVIDSPLRRREKNIYTIKPKSQDDAAIAADCLKTGDAVVVNLEELSRADAVRIIDFMSGVCYGLEGGGHAMKLGDLIFLYTPGDFEIRSDEVDYHENEDPFFKDVQAPITMAPAPPAPTMSGGVSPAGYTNPANVPSQPSAGAPSGFSHVSGSASTSSGVYGDARRAWER